VDVFLIMTGVAVWTVEFFNGLNALNPWFEKIYVWIKHKPMPPHGEIVFILAIHIAVWMLSVAGLVVGIRDRRKPVLKSGWIYRLGTLGLWMLGTVVALSCFVFVGLLSLI
jgi:hypothetical protein